MAGYGMREMDHAKCCISTGICGSVTSGQGNLDEYGYWQIPCHECAERAQSFEQEEMEGEDE